MARYVCPSCGAVYNGKKCRACLYTNFGEGASHKTGTVRTAVPVAENSPVPEKRARRKKPMARFFLLLTVIYSLMPMVRNWGLELKAIERQRGGNTVTVRPEPVVAEENKVILHEEQGVCIFADQEDFADFRDGLCLYAEYTGALAHVTVVMGDVKVNGCDMPFSTLVCKAQRGGNIGKGWLELDEQDLEKNAIGQMESLSFTLTALGSNGRSLFTTEGITIVPEAWSAYE